LNDRHHPLERVASGARLSLISRPPSADDDVLYGYRLRLFALAGEIGVGAACRTMGVHHSTFYRWKPQVERSGLEMLRPRERRAPEMPNRLSPLVEQRIVAFALGQPDSGLGIYRALLLRSGPLREIGFRTGRSIRRWFRC
jgi:hypothetical protein